MENPSNVVSGTSTPVASEGVTTQTQLPEAPVVTSYAPATPVPGSQTPSENLLAALQEERARRRELEDKLNNLNTTTPTDEVYSDEGKLLQTKISTLEQQLAEIREEKELEGLYAKYPLLREKANEFIEYRAAEHPRAKLESAAKLYLAENGLLEPARTGLENPTGGGRVPTPQGLTHDEIKKIRETDHNKYRDMLKKGLIKI
jgi:hypothetical protein